MSILKPKKSARWVLACALLGAALAGAEGKRSIHGTVSYHGGEPAAEAAVELENSTTMEIVSQRTDGQGRYHFDGLNPDLQYTVTAMKKGYWSKKHPVSKFSSKDDMTVDLTLEPKR
ncbi:MAG: carboxypeptidase-like regulatory domain-containing protein [Bryobacteraceae bacterium]